MKTGAGHLLWKLDVSGSTQGRRRGTVSDGLHFEACGRLLRKPIFKPPHMNASCSQERGSFEYQYYSEKTAPFAI